MNKVYLKCADVVGLSLLASLCSIAWTGWHHWRFGVVVLFFKSVFHLLLCFLSKVHARVLESMVQPFVEQCGFGS